MKPFLDDNFLLENKTSELLYHEYAASMPIIDYHNHLSPKEVAENKKFSNISEVWLYGDHYKWRAMRANGVPEKYITGDSTDYEKFQNWAATVPYTLRNPLYHWTHLELKRYFGIDELLDDNTCDEIWERANAQLSESRLGVRGILRQFEVRALCTTDDPTDSLKAHERIATSAFATRVYPTFRPDRVLETEDPTTFNAWV